MQSEAGNYPELTIPADKFAQLEQVVTERNRIRQLIEKAKSGKGKVKEQIYEKVLSGYEAQMSEVAARYEPVREEIAGLLREIRTRETAIRAEFDSANDQIEELRFRCEVGEFGADELAARETEHKNHLEGLQGKLQVVEDTYARCRQFLGDDDFSEAMESGAAPAAAESPAAVEPPAAESPEAEVIATPAPAPEPSGDVEIVSAPAAAGDVDVQAAPPADVDVVPSDDIVIEEGAPLPPPPPPPAPKAPAPPAPKAPPPPKPAGGKPKAPPPPKPAPKAPPPPPASDALMEGNPELTLSEPIPFSPPEESPSPASTLDGGAVPGAPTKSAADVEATVSFQHRSVLNLLKADGKTDTYLLGSDAMSIGRHHTNDIVLLDRSISRKHAEVKKEAEGYVITDMSSGGGMLVNGEKRKRTVMKSGDEIQIGEFKLVFKEEMGM